MAIFERRLKKMNKSKILFSVILGMSLMISLVSAEAGIWGSSPLVNQSGLSKGTLNFESYRAVKWVWNEEWQTSVKTYYWNDWIYGSANGLNPGVRYTLVSANKFGKTCLTTATASSTGGVTFDVMGEKLFNDGIVQIFFVVKSTNINCSTGVYSNVLLNTIKGF